MRSSAPAEDAERERSTLVLWDIDGTLVRVGDVGAAVFDVALERTVGRRPAARVVMSGKTDPQIAAEYLVAMGVTDPSTLVPEVMAHLVAALAEEADRVVSEGRVLPGVEGVLSTLARRADVGQTVLTGNVAANAQVKLGAFAIDRWLNLHLGAYGSDHADRRRLVPVARARAEQAWGVVFAPERTWVVGDSAGDLACARAGGVRCLLVATGRTGVTELAALGPDAVAPDLSDVAGICRLLAGDPAPAVAAPGP